MPTTLEQIKRYTALWRESNTLYEDWARKYGLSYYELLVILSLFEADGLCRQKDICRQWTLPKQTVNTILKNFTERSWVALVPSPEDRRNKDISLTAKGREFAADTANALQAHECAVLEALGSESAEALIETTTLYNKLFKEIDSCTPTDCKPS